MGLRIVLYKIKRFFVKRMSDLEMVLFRTNKYLNPSFSQLGEDLIIKSIFAQLGIKNPSYVDIGAHHPFYLSNTAVLYFNGSRGINIEPDPLLYKAFVKHRKNDINLNIGVSNCNGELDFYIISTPSLNTFSKEEAERYSKEGNYKITNIEKVEVKKIANIVNDYCNGAFPHFLNIDAEGIDEIIIKDLDFKNNYPIVICIETLSFSNHRKGVKNYDLINHIKKQGYFVYADTHLNTILVRKDNWLK